MVKFNERFKDKNILEKLIYNFVKFIIYNRKQIKEKLYKFLWISFINISL
jgi:hypothetical protein